MCSSAQASDPTSQAAEQVWGLRTEAEAQWVRLIPSLPRTSLLPGNSLLCFYGFFHSECFPNPDYSYPLPGPHLLLSGPLSPSEEPRVNPVAADQLSMPWFTLADIIQTNKIQTWCIIRYYPYIPFSESVIRNLCIAFPKHTSYYWPLLRS